MTGKDFRHALYSPELESALLSAVLISPETYLDVRGSVNADSFYLDKHKWIWDAFQTLWDGGQPFDFTCLIRLLEERNQLQEMGGPAYITGLFNRPASSAYAENYAQAVHRDSTRRALLSAAGEIAKLAYDAERPLDETLTDSQAVVRAVALRAGAARDTLQNAHDGVAELYDLISDPGNLTALILPTGLPAVDRALGGGLELGTNTVLMSRPAMGKSAALCQIADAVSEAGRVVAVFTKEMPSYQWLRRMAFRRARVNWDDYRNNRALPDDLRRVSHEIETLSERATLFVDGSKEQTTEQVIALCARLRADRGALDLVIADHLRLFKDTADNETHRLGKISWAFKRLAGELETRVLCAAQLSRAVEGQAERRPDLKDLRDSGEVEENADNVIALYRDSYYTENAKDVTAEFIIRKARESERNVTSRMAFIGPYMSFETLQR